MKYEWNAVNPQPNPSQTRSTAVTNTFTFPKKYFSNYKSASQHNVKLRVPLKPILYLVGLVLAACGTGYWIWGNFNTKAINGDVQAALEGSGASTFSGCEYISLGYANGGYILRSQRGGIFFATVEMFENDSDDRIVYVHNGQRGAVCRAQ